MRLVAVTSCTAEERYGCRQIGLILLVRFDLSSSVYFRQHLTASQTTLGKLSIHTILEGLDSLTCLWVVSRCFY